MTDRVLCIHHNDPDGYAAAWAVRTAPEFARVELAMHEGRYGDAPPDVRAFERVVIVDFSYPAADLRRVGAGRRVQVIDHHASAYDELTALAAEGVIEYTYSCAQAGCELAWWAFHFNAPASPVLAPTDVARVVRVADEPPRVLRYIADRDLWRFELDESREVNAAIASYSLEHDTYAALIAADDIRGLASDGRAILRFQARLIEGMASRAVNVRIGDTTVPCAECSAPELASELGQTLSVNAPFSATWFELADGRRQYSLRSRAWGADVAAIAKRYGGGGHAHAAGFTLAEGASL